MLPYSIFIYFNFEDNAWVATFPDFEMVSASGATPHEALLQAMQAREQAISVMQEQGQPLPMPANWKLIDGNMRDYD